MGVADTLRALSDDDLVWLFTHRRDLTAPPPSTFVELSARASTPHSLQLCIDGLNLFQRQLLDALVFLHDSTGMPATTLEIADLARRAAEIEHVTDGLDGLRRLGLVEVGGHGPEPLWSRLRAVRQAMPTPFRLGPGLGVELDRHPVSELADLARRYGLMPVSPKTTLVAELVGFLTATERMQSVVAAASDQARELLLAVHQQGSVVRVPVPLYDRTRVPDAIRYWLDSTMMLPSGWDVVQLPREVGLFLRGGRPLDQYASRPPAVVSRERQPSSPVRIAGDLGGAGGPELAPSEAVDAVGRLLAAWGHEPPPALKSGGLGVRELRAAAKLLGVPETAAAPLIELAGAAGLLVEEYASGRIMPTEQADDWLDLGPAARWKVLVETWRVLPYEISRAGTRDIADKYIAPLQRSYGEPGVVWRRASVVSAMAEMPVAAELAPDERPDKAVAGERARSVAGARIAASHAPAVESVALRVVWEAPARWPQDDSLAEVVIEIIQEMALLGLTKAGALTRPARIMLLGVEGSDEDDPSIAAMFPASVSTFTVGADLTALAPAELDPTVRSVLATMSDIESRGAATLYRFTDRSLRRAIDRGMDGAELLSFLERHALPNVPQPLRYLIDDVARRYGAVRVGSAMSYIRSDDPALLAEITRTRKMTKFALRQIAPTVAVSPMPVKKVMDALRDAGFFPAEEDPNGAVVMAGPSVQRAPKRLYPRPPDRRTHDDAWSVATGQNPMGAPGLREQAIAATRRLRASG